MLAQDADLYASAELSEKAKASALIAAVLKVIGSGRCDSEDDLEARLIKAGTVFDPADLSTALTRLELSGRLMRPRPRPTPESPNPPRALLLSTFPAGEARSVHFDRFDGLAPDTHACIKKRGDEFDSDEQLEQWLAEDGINYTPNHLLDALRQLEISGLLIRPHQSRDWPSDPLPGYLNTPSWARSY